ncbi:MAG: hypothetical protein Q8P57_04795 [Candidatus Pacearchaeota archaeon]|nr:hypothetical protein [Candidatus Pacearchaeota archaeon]
MEGRTKGYFVIMFILLTIILIFGFLLITEKTSALSQTDLEECNIIDYNSEDAINLVFFSTNEQAEEYSDFLFNSAPFNEYKSSFNTFSINYEPECEFYKGIAILCYSPDLLKKAASCPNDYIIVLKSEETKTRSSAYRQVMSLNLNLPLTVLLHEIGHTLSNLAEEYTPANILRNSENCVKECSDFPQDIDSCSSGCSETNYYRSIPNGIMRTLSSQTFGKFNEDLIIKAIEEQAPKSQNAITGKQVLDRYTECENQKYTLYDVYKEEARVFPGCANGNINKKGENKAIISNKGIKIEELFFSSELITETQFEDQETLNGESFKEINKALITLTYPPKGDEIKIYDSEGNLISSSSLTLAGSEACII